MRPSGGFSTTDWRGRLETVSRELLLAVCFYCVQGERTYCPFFVKKQGCARKIPDLYCPFLLLMKVTHKALKTGQLLQPNGASVGTADNVVTFVGWIHPPLLKNVQWELRKT